MSKSLAEFRVRRRENIPIVFSGDMRVGKNTDGMASSDPACLDFIHSPWEAVVEYYGKEKLLEINAQYERRLGEKTAER